MGVIQAGATNLGIIGIWVVFKTTKQYKIIPRESLQVKKRKSQNSQHRGTPN